MGMTTERAWEQEIVRRANAFKGRRHLFVDFYRIRHRLVWPLPIRVLDHPAVPVRGFSAAYPWAIWMSWALEERISALGLAAEWNADTDAAAAARIDLEALCDWPGYLHTRCDARRAYLAFAHSVRTMCVAAKWAWPDDALRRALHVGLGRAVDEMLPWSNRLHGTFSDRKTLIEAPEPHKHLHNITLIATLATACAARLADHPAAARLDRRAKILVGALLTLRWRGVTETVSYDGYVMDFVADWLAGLPEEERNVFFDHPRFGDTLVQSYGLAVPGDLVHVAELGDVEPREMPFHISAQAKLQALKPDPLRAWYLQGCDPRHLRVDALAALKQAASDTATTRQPVPPNQTILDVNYALVLRSGWERADVAVAVGASKSPMGHVHCDNGSLVIGTRGRWVIDDAGYQQYLDTAERQFTTGPQAHNAPVINGFAQISKRLTERRLEQPADDVRVAHLDLTPSYPAGAGIGRLARTVWLLGREHVVVCDHLTASVLQSLRYTWHGHRDCGWLVENGVASLHAPDEAEPLIFVSSPQLAFEASQITRLRGSRGQMSLTVDIEPEKMPAFRDVGLIAWLFSFREARAKITFDGSCLSIDHYRLDASMFG
ncbi:hypothetical protein GCM10007923_00050 [Shinella yambaruensis]|uniref:Heparinase II/III-like C-terminal domain-containing protein n=2 Tax=Shinella yambaruensis TaxID=415996 RepID=A0ABQ5Z9W3_9HYPH|nr:hypothetical protein GCM10007923_00050 [Shinella yambaruensis]